MKCFSRSTIGLIIGGLNILFYVGVFYQFLMFYKDKSHLDAISLTIVILLLISFAILLIFTGLLIYGIIKKRPSFMKPWLFVCGIVIGCIIIFIGFVLESFLTWPHQTTFVFLAFGCFLLFLQILSFYTIYRLYKDMSQNNEFPIQVGFTTENGGYTNVSSGFTTEPPSYTEKLVDYSPQSNYYKEQP